MTEQTEFKNLDQRIELFSLMMQLTHEYVEYFGNANCALIMQVLFYEQYCKFKEGTQTDYSVGVTLAYITARTGLPKSTVHDQLKKMLRKDIFVQDGNKFKFRLTPDGLPKVQTELPRGLIALRNFTNFLVNYQVAEE